METDPSGCPTGTTVNTASREIKCLFCSKTHRFSMGYRKHLLSDTGCGHHPVLKTILDGNNWFPESIERALGLTWPYNIFQMRAWNLYDGPDKKAVVKVQYSGGTSEHMVVR